MRPIYLDYNATTPISPSVHEAMEPFLTEYFGNPSSRHASGRICREAMEDARGRLATLLGADTDEIIFTSGGTESNNLALMGLLAGDGPDRAGHLVISTLEHPAIKAPAEYLARQGIRVTVVACDQHGVVDPNDVEQVLEHDTRLVSIMHANNEVGTVQPVREIADLCHARGIHFHTDAAQSVGKVRTQVDQLDVDLLSIAGHKLYAPKGVGALFVRRGVHITPVLHGAGQEQGLRPGTENVASIVGLGRAAHLASQGLDGEHMRLETLRERLLAGLRHAIGPRLTVNGSHAPERLPNTLSVNFPDVAGADLLRRCPEIRASTGAACHADQVAMSPVLQAIGLPARTARGTVRLSLGWYTSEEDIDRATQLLASAWETLL